MVVWLPGGGRGRWTIRPTEARSRSGSRLHGELAPDDGGRRCLRSFLASATMATPIRPLARSLLRRRRLLRSGCLQNQGTAAHMDGSPWIGARWAHLRCAFSATAYGRAPRPSRRISSLSPGQVEGDDSDRTYASYQQALKELQEFHRERERVKSERMFQAWQSAEAAAAAAAEPATGQRRPRKPGVAVVQTLANETRSEQATLQEQEHDLRRRAQTLLERAARQGHAQALVRLGNQALEEAHAAWGHRNAESTRNALDRAMDLYRQSQAAEGWFNLGSLLWSGYPDYPNPKGTGNAEESEPVVLLADFSASMEAFKEAILLGDADAMYFVGVTELGAGEDEPIAETVDEATLSTLRHGLALVQDAADRGHGGAMHYLSLLYLNGHRVLGIPPCDPHEFVTRLDAAAAADHADALFLRGHCYYNGDHGYPQDIRQALGDFLKAADQGNADAAVSAGAILHRGYPPLVMRDQERAFKLYQHAGELGSIEGWRNVVACYATGEGVPQNTAIAKYIAETMLTDDLKGT